VESFHVIEGEADAVFFDDAGAVTAVVPLGDFRSGKDFYYRVADCGYHTLILRSPALLFHEATTGPFRPEETLGAPWSPAEGDLPGSEHFRGHLEEQVRRFRERGREP
jgi:cupin fold WbuC family metalloprotein